MEWHVAGSAGFSAGFEYSENSFRRLAGQASGLPHGVHEGHRAGGQNADAIYAELIDLLVVFSQPASDSQDWPVILFCQRGDRAHALAISSLAVQVPFGGDN